MGTNDGSFLLETYECELGSELYADGKLYVTLPNGASTGASFNVQVGWEEMIRSGDIGYEVLRTVSDGLYNTTGPNGVSSISYQADLSNNNRTLRISKAKFQGFGSPFTLYFRAKITIGNGLTNDSPIYSRIAGVWLKPCPLHVISDIKLHQSETSKNIGFLLKIKKISFKNPSVKDVAENVAKSIPIMTKECLDGEYGVNDPFDAFSIGNFSTMNNKTIVGSRVKEKDTYILLGDPETIGGTIESIWNPRVGYNTSYDHMAPGMFNTLQMGGPLSNFGGLTFFAMKVDWVNASEFQQGSPKFIEKYNEAKGTDRPLIIKKGKIKIGITDGIQKVNSSPYTKSREDSVTILTNNIELVGFDKGNPGLYFEVIEVIGIKDQETSEDAIICSTKC